MSSDITQEDVDDALSDIEDLIESIGDEVVDHISGHNERGLPFTGLEVQHGDHSYQIVGSPSLNHMKILTGFDAAEALAANEAGNPQQGSEVQLAEQALQSAQHTLQSQATGDLATIRDELINRTSVDDIVVQLNAEGEFVSGFQVESRLYVYDDPLTVSQFYSEVQQVINVLWRGQECLINRYNLRGTVEDGGEELRGFA